MRHTFFAAALLGGLTLTAASPAGAQVTYSLGNGVQGPAVTLGQPYYGNGYGVPGYGLAQPYGGYGSTPGYYGSYAGNVYAPQGYRNPTRVYSSAYQGYNPGFQPNVYNGRVYYAQPAYPGFYGSNYYTGYPARSGVYPNTPVTGMMRIR
jgi:hypothetical protein